MSADHLPQCPLFGQLKPDKGDDQVVGESHASLEDSHTPLEDGLVFNQRALDRVINPDAPNQQVVVSDEDGSDLDDLLAGFSKKERKKILRKLAKMRDSDSEEEEKPKKKKKHKKEHRSSKVRRSRERSRSPERTYSKHGKSDRRSKVRERSRSPDSRSRHRRH